MSYKKGDLDVAQNLFLAAQGVINPFLNNSYFHYHFY